MRFSERFSLILKYTEYQAIAYIATKSWLLYAEAPTEYGRNGTGLSPKKQRDTVEEATPYRRKSDDISAKKQPNNGA